MPSTDGRCRSRRRSLPSFAASRSNCSTRAATAPASSCSSARTSIVVSAPSGTTLSAEPPCTSTTLTVTVGDDSGNDAIARASGTIALTPASGEIPECAARPRMLARTMKREGAAATCPPIAPGWSKTNPLRARMIEQSNAVEPTSPCSSPTVKHELDAWVGSLLEDDRPDRLEHDGERRLVVGADDRRGGVPDDAFAHDRAQRVGGGDGVEVSAEEQRAPGRRCRDVTVEVVAVAAHAHGGAVTTYLEAKVAEVGHDRLAACALRARRARNRGERAKQLDQTLLRGTVDFLDASRWRGAPSLA